MAAAATAVMEAISERVSHWIIMVSSGFDWDILMSRGIKKVESTLAQAFFSRAYEYHNTIMAISQGQLWNSGKKWKLLVLESWVHFFQEVIVALTGGKISE